MRNSLSYLTVFLTVFFSSALSAEQNLMRDFATCTGRLSAEVEHSWLVATVQADRNAVMYANMASLLAAVTAPEDEIRARALRIDAKAAHSQLLLQSAFGWNAEQRQFAERRARELTMSCSALILADSRENSAKIWAIGTE
ncbi:MAG: hypothetical protein AAGO57_04810 [Pseudomonadota bacterium]